MPASDVRTSNPTGVALAAWLLPGLGYWLIGQRTRGITVGITIIVLFILGVTIGGIGVVDAPPLRGNIVANVLQKPWFVGQALTGPIGLASAWAAAEIPAARDARAKARLGDIATLYTAIAGMLNLMAIIDSSYRASRIEGRRG